MVKPLWLKEWFFCLPAEITAIGFLLQFILSRAKYTLQGSVILLGFLLIYIEDITLFFGT